MAPEDDATRKAREDADKMRDARIDAERLDAQRRQARRDQTASSA
jgi:hypothetical protein